MREGDILVAKTDPPLLSVLALHLASRRGVRVVNWLQDLYPEVAVELGVPLVGGVSRALVALRDRSLRGAAMNVAISEGMRDRLLQTYAADPAQVTVIPHGAVDQRDIRPRPRTDRRPSQTRSG